MTGKSKKNECHCPSFLWKVRLGRRILQGLCSVSGAIVPDRILPLLVTECGSLVSEHIIYHPNWVVYDSESGGEGGD